MGLRSLQHGMSIKLSQHYVLSMFSLGLKIQQNYNRTVTELDFMSLGTLLWWKTFNFGPTEVSLHALLNPKFDVPNFFIYHKFFYINRITLLKNKEMYM